MDTNPINSQANYQPPEPFRFWCQKVLPTEYDDSLSYYELLNKVVTKLNEVIDYTTTSVINIGRTLKDWVDEYLDRELPEEIIIALDKLVEDGILDRIFTDPVYVERVIAPILTDWLSDYATEHGISAPLLDTNLTHEDEAAESKAVGDRLKKYFSLGVEGYSSTGGYTNVLAENTDLDSLSAGNYRTSTYEVTNTLVHKPSEVANVGVRIICIETTATNRFYQILLATNPATATYVNNSGVYIRSKSTATAYDSPDYSSSEWSDWVRLATNGYVDAQIQTVNTSLAALDGKLRRTVGTNYGDGTSLGVGDEHDDLNDITYGNYYASTTAASLNVWNTPWIDGSGNQIGSPIGFDLTALRIRDEYYFQILYAYETTSHTEATGVYVRRKIANAWSNWVRVSSEEYVKVLKAIPTVYTGATALTASEGNTLDLNTLGAGNYRLSNSADAAYVSHTPITNASFRLVCLESTGTSRYYQIMLANTGSSQTWRSGIWVRRKPTTSASAWTTWKELVIDDNTIIASDALVSDSNIGSYFTAREDEKYYMADAPHNTIYGIMSNKLFADSPPADWWTGAPNAPDTYNSGLLVTLTQNPRGTIARFVVQMFITYRTTDYKPTFAYRVATTASNPTRYVWSDWSKFEQNGYLHSGNAIIYGGYLDIAPFTDLNDAPPMGIYQLDLNLTGDDETNTLGHHPFPGKSCVMMTYAFSYSSPHGRVQVVYCLQGGVAWRYGYQDSDNEYNWTDWYMIPVVPNSVGNYTLKCVVTAETVDDETVYTKTYEWVSD